MTTWQRNEPTAARRRAALDITAIADGVWAPLATDFTGKLKIRLGGVAWTTASGTLTNTGYDGHWVYEATQAETDIDANEVELLIDDAVYYAQSFVAVAYAAPGANALLPAGTVTLASVRGIVRLRGDYVNTRKFPDSYLNTEIQSAWVELFELMDDVCEGWWDTQATVSTVANQAYVALPTVCKRVLGVDILIGTDYQELRQVTTGERNRFGSSVGQPTAYRLSSRGVELLCTPDMIYTLRVTFSPICPALHETNGIELYGLDEYIVTAALLHLDQREQRAVTERLAELERQRVRVIKSANKRKQQEPEYLNLREFSGSDPFWDGIL